LDHAEIVSEIGGVLRRYGIASAWTDSHGATSIAALAAERGYSLVRHTFDAEEEVRLVSDLAAQLAMRQWALPDDSVFADDLKRVRRVVTARGGVRIALPTTPDGRHCDYVPAMLRVMRFLQPPRPTTDNVDADYE